MTDSESLKQTWVYRYVYWDADERREKTSRVYATLDVIHLGLGRPVPDSAIRVSSDEIAGGIFIPTAGVAANNSSEVRDHANHP